VKRTRLSLIGIGLLFAATRALIPHPNDVRDERGLSFILSFPCSILLFVWCKAHAEARGITPPAASAPLVALLPPVGVPYYFYRTMSLPSATLATAKSICYFIGVFAVSVGAACLSARVT
jgi:hypothetical protein